MTIHIHGDPLVAPSPLHSSIHVHGCRLNHPFLTIIVKYAVMHEHTDQFASVLINISLKLIKL